LRSVFIVLVVTNIVIAALFGVGFSKGIDAGGDVLQVDVQFDNLVLSRLVNGVVAVPKAKDLGCIELGELNDLNSAEQIVARLASVDIEAEVVFRSFEVVKDYWVYIPPYSGYSEAKSKVAELDLKGVDSFIFSEGELKNGLSLGVYGNRGNATGIFKRVSDLGYSPKIKETTMESRVYGVLIDESSVSYFNDRLFESLRTRYVDIKEKMVSCK